MNLIIADSPPINTAMDATSIKYKGPRLDPRKKLTPAVFNRQIMSRLNWYDFSTAERVCKNWGERNIVEKTLKLASLDPLLTTEHHLSKQAAKERQLLEKTAIENPFLKKAALKNLLIEKAAIERRLLEKENRGPLSEQALKVISEKTTHEHQFLKKAAKENPLLEKVTIERLLSEKTEKENQLLEKMTMERHLSKIIKRIDSLFSLHTRDKTCYLLAEMYIQKNDIDNADLFMKKIVLPTIKDKAHLQAFRFFLGKKDFKNAELNSNQIVSPNLKDKFLRDLVFEMAQAGSEEKAYKYAEMNIQDRLTRHQSYANIAYFSIKKNEMGRAEECINRITDPVTRMEARKKLYYGYLKNGKMLKALIVLYQISTDPLLKDLFPIILRDT